MRVRQECWLCVLNSAAGFLCGVFHQMLRPLPVSTTSIVPCGAVVQTHLVMWVCICGDRGCHHSLCLLPASAGSTPDTFALVNLCLGLLLTCRRGHPLARVEASSALQLSRSCTFASAAVMMAAMCSCYQDLSCLTGDHPTPCVLTHDSLPRL